MVSEVFSLQKKNKKFTLSMDSLHKILNEGIRPPKQVQVKQKKKNRKKIQEKPKIKTALFLLGKGAINSQSSTGGLRPFHRILDDLNYFDLALDSTIWDQQRIFFLSFFEESPSPKGGERV